MRLLLICIAIGLSASVALAQPWQLGHLTTTLTDASRSNRSIPVEIYYPAITAGNGVAVAGAAGDKYPVLVFGHGFSMNYDAYENFWTTLVPQGYIIIFPKTEIGPIPFPSHSTFGLDMSYMVDWFLAINNDNASIFHNRISGKTAVLGHSMGGGCSFLAVPQNPNITALATFAPAETNPSAIAAAAGISIPSLVFAGSKDCVAPPIDNQLPMYNALTSAFKTYVSITDGSHCQFAESNFLCNFGESSSCAGATYVSRASQHATQFSLLLPWLNFVLKGQCDQYTLFQNRLTAATGFTWQQVSNVLLPIASVTPSATAPLCAPQPVQLTAAPAGLSYEWSTGDTTDTVTVNQSGLYSVIITNSYNCSDTADITLSIPTSALSAVTVSASATCNPVPDGSASVITTGGFEPYNYSWSGGTPNATGDTVTGLNQGNYVVTITDSIGCTLTDTLTVSGPSTFTISTNSLGTTCNGTSDGMAWVSIAGTGMFTKLWSTSDQTDTITNLSAGSYSVTVTDQNGCSVAAPVMVTQPAALTTTAVTDAVSCYGYSDGTAWVTTSGGTGPYTYNWPGGIQNDTLTGFSAGTRTIITTDANGCTATFSVTINQPSPLTRPAVLSSGLSFCPGDTADLYLSRPFSSYTWSEGSTDANLSTTAPGNYWVAVTDSNGCYAVSDTITIAVFQPYLSSVLFNLSNDTLYIIDGIVQQWQLNGSTLTSGGNYVTPVANGGYYEVEVTDSNGCSYAADTVITFTGITTSGGNTISIYPNPADELVTISNSLSQNLAITDVTGRNMDVVFTQNYGNVLVNLSSLEAGIYFLIDRSRQAVQKVIVQ